MADVEKGSIKKLMILESLPKPINFTGGMDPLSYVGAVPTRLGGNVVGHSLAIAGKPIGPNLDPAARAISARAARRATGGRGLAGRKLGLSVT